MLMLFVLECISNDSEISKNIANYFFSYDRLKLRPYDIFPVLIEVS